MAEEVEKKDKKPIYKKWWFWAIVIVIIIAAIGSSGDTENGTRETNSSKISNKVAVTVVDFSSMSRKDIEAWANENKVKIEFAEDYSNKIKKGSFISQSVNANGITYQGDKLKIVYSLGKAPTTEEKNALKKAESYSEIMHMSQKGIYKQLTSEYGEGFTKEAAQYAIDNIKADWNKNALEKAKTYQDTMHMSKKAIYKQLISEYGEQFTKSQAQYAIDNLDK